MLFCTYNPTTTICEPPLRISSYTWKAWQKTILYTCFHLVFTKWRYHFTDKEIEAQKPSHSAFVQLLCNCSWKTRHFWNSLNGEHCEKPRALLTQSTLPPPLRCLKGTHIFWEMETHQLEEKMPGLKWGLLETELSQIINLAFSPSECLM